MTYEVTPVMSLLHELPPVRRFRFPFTPPRACFRLGGKVYEAVRDLECRDTREPLLLARREDLEGSRSLRLIERVHGPSNARPSTRMVEELTWGLWVRHPGLLQLLDVAAEGNRLYAVREYVGGWRLDAVLRLGPLLGRRPLSVEAVCHVGAELAEALHHLHTWTDPSGQPMSLFHGHVSARHVWLTLGGRVKLEGFGTRASRAAAQVYSRQEWSEAVRESLYGPPLEDTGRARGAPRDLYGLAVVLLELLRGRPLWEPLAPERWRWGLPPDAVRRELRWLKVPADLGEVLREALLGGEEPFSPALTASRLRYGLRRLGGSCLEFLARELREARGLALSRLRPWDSASAVLQALPDAPRRAAGA